MIEDRQTQQLLEGDLLENVSDFFKALGNGTRLQIIWCLSPVSYTHLRAHETRKSI